ncbi:MAG: acetyl-CoA carboxylase carboxyltransferase subunit alpha [Endomicrobiales bacterium]
MADEIAGLDFEKPIQEVEKRIAGLKASQQEGALDLSGEIKVLEEKCLQLKNEVYGGLTTWQRVQVARHPRRPYTLDYVKLVFTDFVELHGDRAFQDDRAMICGLAFLGKEPVALIGHQKGRNIQENMERNFGMAHPEGYRKALRIMKTAEKFDLPVITFIDTPGAYPGIGAEERGQAEAIARNLREMSNLRIPVISLIIGEGGSGGALGIGIANRVLMLENAYYSVITPEGCAAILFRDAAKAPDAAAALKITAQDLLQAKVIDEIVAEPLGGAHRDITQTAGNIREALTRHLASLKALSPGELAADRYRKFRAMGVYVEQESAASAAPKSAKKTR